MEDIVGEPIETIETPKQKHKSKIAFSENDITETIQKQLKKSKIKEFNKEKDDDDDDDDEDGEDEDEDDDEESDDEDFDMSQMHLGSILQSFFTSEEHEINICDSILTLKKSVDTQNKILMKLVSAIEKFSPKK